MSITTQAPVVLEPESQAFVEATAKPPFLYELTPDEARKVLDDVQAEPSPEPSLGPPDPHAAAGLVEPVDQSHVARPGAAVGRGPPGRSAGRCRPGRAAFRRCALLRAQEHLDGFSLVHSPVAGGGFVKRQFEVEDLARFDLAIPDQVDQLGEKAAHWGGAPV
jgi:hypothetical protein